MRAPWLWPIGGARPAQSEKNFMDKDTPPEEMIRGLLDCMPQGMKTVTVLPAEAVKALADGGAWPVEPSASATY